LDARRVHRRRSDPIDGFAQVQVVIVVHIIRHEVVIAVELVHGVVFRAV
jgi:hypothetical protein